MAFLFVEIGRLQGARAQATVHAAFRAVREASLLRIQRALIMEMLVVFVLVASLVTAAVFTGSTIRFMGAGGDALSSELIAHLLPKFLPIALGFAVPFSWLAAVALTMGRWSADHELTIVRTAGWSMSTLAMPVLAMGAILAVGAMAFHAYYVPVSHRTVRSTMKDYLPKFLGSLRGTDRSISMKHGRFSFRTFRDGAFHDVELERRGPSGELLLKVLAKRMSLSQLRVDGEDRSLLYEVERALFITDRGGETEVKTVTGTSTLNMGAVARTGVTSSFANLIGVSRWTYRPKDMTANELLYLTRRTGGPYHDSERPKLALHGRLSLGASVFFLALFALAMSLVLPPTGRRVRDALLCILPAISIFAPLYIAGPSFAKRFGMDPWIAMWLPNVLLIVASLVVVLLGRRQ